MEPGIAVHWSKPINLPMRTAFILLLIPIIARAAPLVLETPHFTLTADAATGRVELHDRAGGITWKPADGQTRLGTAVLRVEGKERRVPLTSGEGAMDGGGIALRFHPLDSQPAAALRVTLRSGADGRGLAVGYECDAALPLERLRLLDDLLTVTAAEQGAVVMPVREGLLIPADSGKNFTRQFDTYAYEGCHMAMCGFLKSGAALLAWWDDPYALVELRSTAGGSAPQTLTAALDLRKSAREFHLRVLGKGDHNAVGHAYREVAKARGLLVPWTEKLKGHPERAPLQGAVNVKLWSLLDRRMDEESAREESVRVNWTFDEAAQIAEHLKRDLRLERVLFLIGGWIHRGYDNRHPDILPAAPECGGDAAFADCARRVRASGYILGLHDNYQDIYRDSPSWDERLIMRTPGGGLAKGGRWAGGRAFLTCAQTALELAKRPQNLPAVRQLAGPAAYFIDTTYAAGLQECSAPEHPLTRLDDMRWKQALSDYARGQFGMFGSECGREWAIPHADFFEGITGVSGRAFHDEHLVESLGAAPVPLFEMVYRDCIAAHGKYGYDVMQSAGYVLRHIGLGRPLHYHSIPPHLYWKEPSWDGRPLPLRPAVAEFKDEGARQFSLTYRWTVKGPVALDWPVFVHFTDAQGTIRFQGDYTANPPMSRWQPGDVTQGPFRVKVPAGVAGVFDVRIGMFDRRNSGSRPALLGEADGEHRYLIGQIKVTDDKIEFVPPAVKPSSLETSDPGVFARSDGGWAAGLHHMDRFIKNTAEILSPMHELTAAVPLTRHEFLTPDRTAQRVVFGEGAEALTAIVNAGPSAISATTPLGGEVVLPPNGFVIESPRFAAFHALAWGGLRYESAPLFTLRSADDLPLARSGRIRVFHAFGDPRLHLGGKELRVEKEQVVTP